jgi:ribonuclease E
MEEEAIKDNTLHVQAQVPVPVATYLLNEKRRSVMHVEKHHNVRVLIVPNPHMDTPQYEVVRVKTDETTSEASYELPVKQAELEEAKMPKFDKSATKRDEPLIQGMSAPKRVTQAENKSNNNSRTVSRNNQKSGFFVWLKNLFSSEDVVEEIIEKTPPNKPRRSQNRRDNQQGKRRNNRGNTRGNNRNNNDDISKNDGSTKNNESKNTRNKKDDIQTKPRQHSRKPELADKEKVVKQEKVAEKRQRRSNRKKVRVLPTHPVNESEKVLNTQKSTGIDSVKPSTAENKNNTEDVNETKPKNRRSPRHLRSNGQRRRRDNKLNEGNNEVAEAEPSNNKLDESVEARYPLNEVVISNEEQPEVTEKLIKETIEQSKVADVLIAKKGLELTTPENNPRALGKTDILEKQSIIDTPKVTAEADSNTSPKAETVELSTSEIDGSLTSLNNSSRLENTDDDIKTDALKGSKQNNSEEVSGGQQSPSVAGAQSVKVEETVTEVQQELPLAEEKEATEQHDAEVLSANQESERISIANDDITELVTEGISQIPSKVEVKQIKNNSSVTKNSPSKDKKLARQVKKANRLSGRATAPMTRTETIAIVNTIPTNAMLDDERPTHQSSGRSAIIADIANRSSAEATKP